MDGRGLDAEMFDDFTPRELRDRNDGASAPRRDSRQRSKPESFERSKPFRVRRERDVIDHDDGRHVQQDGRGVLRREEHVELVGAARTACAQLATWEAHGAQGPPRPPSNEKLDDLFTELTERLAELERITSLSDLSNLPIDVLNALVRSLVEERPTLVKLPELHRLGRIFTDAGIEGDAAGIRLHRAARQPQDQRRMPARDAAVRGAPGARAADHEGQPSRPGSRGPAVQSRQWDPGAGSGPGGRPDRVGIRHPDLP